MKRSDYIYLESLRKKAFKKNRKLTVSDWQKELDVYKRKLENIKVLRDTYEYLREHKWKFLNDAYDKSIYEIYYKSIYEVDEYNAMTRQASYFEKLVRDSK